MRGLQEALRLAMGVAVPMLASAAAPAVAESDLWSYRIERGDTLIGLHARLMRPDARWQDVQRLNRIANPRRLQPGSELRIPLSMLRAQVELAEVLHVHGQVFVEGREGRRPLAAAATVAEGDLVTTGAQSSASLRFADGTRSAIGPDAQLRVARHARLGASGQVQTQVQLDRGSLQTQVPVLQPPARVEVRTPVVNLGVRGTDFRTRIDGDRTLAEVVQGRVGVGPQPVDAGFGAAATAAAVSPPRPLLPAPDLAALPARLERLVATLPLPAQPGVSRYRLQIHDTASPSALLLEALFTAPQAQWPLALPDGRYQLLARAADADGIEGLESRASFELAARPEPPFLLRPRPNEVREEASITLEWSRNPEAARYRLQVASAADFGDPVAVRDDLPGTTADVPLPPGRYLWRVGSIRADGHRGPWGDAQAVVRLPPPPAPPPSRPPQLDDAGLTVSWSASPQPGVRYQLQVARDGDFASPLLDVVTERSEQLLPGLAPGAYHVRVRTQGADGRQGPFGAAQVVDVPEPPSRWWLWLLALPLLLLP